MLNGSLMEPPGCITALMPAFFAISTQSGNGKKASLAITAPCKSKPKDWALCMAWFKASTRLVCPVPLAHSCLFLANTIVFDLVCLQIFEANNKFSNSFFEGILFVTFEIFSAVYVAVF